jgi:membrane protease YdiL (CAAX protease family)
MLLSAEDLAVPVRHRRAWRVVTALEVVAACGAVVLDLAVPSIVLALMALVSSLVRRDGPASLGLRRSDTPWLVPKMLVFGLCWSAVQVGLTMPVANHLSGTTQDLSAFDGIEGNVGRLIGFVVLGWVVGALLEEIAYRGYLQTRLRQLLGNGAASLVTAIVVSSLLFGRVHSEQGLIGVAIVTLDGVAWSVLRYRYRSLWASVLAHGFNNTIGFVTFFFIGPVYGLS